ncbi:MAG: formate dehydrogenase accessory protein FdhE [Thermodesulfobacteriota bacterium]
MNQSDALNELRRKKEALLTRWPLYAPLVEWLVELLEETELERWSDPGAGPVFNPEEIRPRFDRGLTLFEPASLPVDVDRTWDLYRILAEKTSRRLGSSRTTWLEVGRWPRPRFEALIQAAFEPDSKSLSRLGFEDRSETEAVLLLLRLALRPGLKYLARTAAAGLDLTRWSHGHCPVCGSAPVLAEGGGETTAHKLHCGWCETSWTFPRRRCPFCEKEMGEGLKYLYAEGEAGLRVMVCPHCQSRLKTLDRRHIHEPIVPVLDELASSHLDLAAAGPARNDGDAE